VRAVRLYTHLRMLLLARSAVETALLALFCIYSTALACFPGEYAVRNHEYATSSCSACPSGRELRLRAFTSIYGGTRGSLHADTIVTSVQRWTGQVTSKHRATKKALRAAWTAPQARLRRRQAKKNVLIVNQGGTLRE
jgi:hypothetical protein